MAGDARNVLPRARPRLSATGGAAGGQGRFRARSHRGVGVFVCGRHAGPAQAGRGDGGREGDGYLCREVHDLFVRDPDARRLMVGGRLTAGTGAAFRYKHDVRMASCFSKRSITSGLVPAWLRPPDAIYHRRWVGDVSGAHTVYAVPLPYGYYPVSSPPAMASISLGDGGRPAAVGAVRRPGAYLHSRSERQERDDTRGGDQEIEAQAWWRCPAAGHRCAGAPLSTRWRWRRARARSHHDGAARIQDDRGSR